ncbi:MAG: hypothetical protein NVS9B4_23360 [Candidatus Acidiferrum sp.]
MSCVSQPKEWIDYASATAPILVSVFVAWVACRQLKLGRDKLRLDLYERRFAVYERTLAFYHALIGSAESLQSESFSQLHKDFIKSYRESQFLFKSDSGIFQLLGELHSRAFNVTGFKEHGKELAGHPETLMKMNNDATEALSYFSTAIEQLENAIAPYLNFRKVLA